MEQWDRESSGALINKSEEYLKLLKIREEKKNKVEMQQKIEKLESDVGDIKQLLNKILEKFN